MARRQGLPRNLGDLSSPSEELGTAMRGAPAKAIQELAGHENLSTTQRYMHLNLAAKDAAISLLDEAASQISGDGDLAEARALKRRRAWNL